MRSASHLALSHVSRVPSSLRSCALWLTLLALISGCRGPSCPTMPYSDATAALHSFRSLHRTVRAVRGEARVDRLSDDEGRVRGTVLIYHERPGRLRFDVMTQLGPAAVMTSDGSQFQLLDLHNERFVSGAATADNVHRFLGVSLPAHEVARLLLGDTPRLEGEPTIHCTDEGYLVEIRARGKRQEMVYEVRPEDENVPPEAQHLRLVRSEMFMDLGDDQASIWRVTFDDHEVVLDPDDAEGRGVAMPFRIRFEDDRRGSDTLIRFRSREIVTEPAPPGAFEQAVPGGVAVESL